MAIVGALSSPAIAEMIWTQSDIVQSLSASSITASADFVFRNAGSSQLTIRAIRPSCNCTTTGANKIYYAPGEMGVIRAQTELKSHQADTVEYTIDVYYEDPQPHVQTLRWTIKVPDPVVIAPRTLSWSAGATGETRIIGIARAGNLPITVTSVEALGDGFSWKLVTVSDSDVFQLQVRPHEGLRDTESVMRIFAGSPGFERWHEVVMRVD